MNSQVSELRRRAEALASELADIRDEISRVETNRFVQVHFPGNTRSYTYELAPGHEARVGDYVCVHSPMTLKNELVRVAYMGRGGTRFPNYKIARAVSVRIRPDGDCIEGMQWERFRRDSH